MSKYVGLGNQIILFHYRTNIDWNIFDNIFVNLFSSGVIKCDSCLQLDDASHFTVKAGLSLFIKPKNELTEILKVETTTDFQLGITNPTTEKFLVAEYDYQQDSTHGVDFLLLDSGDINSAYHVVIAELIYDGSNNLVGFNYSTQTKSYGIHSHDQQYYNKIESDNRFVNTNGDTMIGDLNMSSHKIINVVNPTNNQDVATKYYVDHITGSSENFYYELFDVDNTIISNSYINLSNIPKTNSQIVILNGIILTPGNTRDYEISGTTITFYCYLELNDLITVQYVV